MNRVDVAEDAGPDARSADDAKRDLLSALTGYQANREGAVAFRTRRVVSASMGVMRDQKAGSKRGRSVALAFLLLVLLALGPFAWRIADDLIDGEHFSDLATQCSLFALVLCLALMAAALVAGWVRHKS